MKFIKRSIFVLLIFLQCFFCGQTNSDQTNQYYYHYFKDHASLSVPAHLNDVKENKRLYQFVADNDTKGVTFLNTIQKQSKSIIYFKSNDDVYKKTLFSSSDIKYLSSGDSVSKYTGDQLGKYTYEFHAFSPHTNALEGMIVIYSLDQDVLVTIKEQLKTQFNLDGEIQSASTQSHEKELFLPYSMEIGLSYIAVVNSVLFVVLLLLYSLRQRKISVYRLYGKSVHKIIMEAWCKDVGLYLILMLILGTCYRFMLYSDGGINDYIKFMMIVGILQMLCFSLFYVVLYVLIKKSQILNGIRNHLQNRSLLVVNAAVKFMIIILSSIICTNLISSIILVSGEYETSKHLLEVTKNSIQFDGMRADLNFSNEELATIFYDTQAALEKSDSMYIDPTVYEYDFKKPSEEEIAYDLMMVFDDTVRVNKTFLKENQIVDINGDEINFLSEDQTMQPVFAIPESKWSDEQIQSIKESPMFQGMVFTFTKIKDGQEVFAFSAKAGIPTNGFIKDAIFLVDGGYETNRYIINLDNIKGDSMEKRYKNWLYKNDIPDIYFYRNPSDLVQIVVNDLQGKLIQSIVQFIFLLIAIFILSYQFIYTYICSHRKKIFIYKTNGASLLERYSGTLIIFLTIYILGIFALLFMSQNASMLSLLMIFGLDSSVVLYLLIRLEKHAIALELKGGE
ncbi:hypothetical protein [Amedibacillus sp. YH-ame10]